MSEIESLLQAIATLRPDLPTLIDAEWPRFEAELDTCLSQIRQSPSDRSPILRARLLALFSRHPGAHRRLVELLDKVREEAPHSVRGTYRRAGGASTPANPPTLRSITRYTDIACPRQIWLHSRRIPVVVRLTIAPLAHSTATEALVLCGHRPVQVHIKAPGFEVLNTSPQVITLIHDQDSAPVVFDLRPLDLGHADITLDFFQAGNHIGTVTVAVQVTQEEVAEDALARPSQSLQIEPDAPAADRVLRIRWDSSASALSYTLTQAGSTSWIEEPRPIHIDTSPLAHATALYRQIASLADSADPAGESLLQRRLEIPPADVDRRIKRLGQSLWRDLIPEGLKALYAQERERWHDHTLLILSDEPHIPWELVWPYEAGSWEDEGPWCQTLLLTRWLCKNEKGNGNTGAPSRVSAKALAVLAPVYSKLPNLPAAQQERQLMLDLISRHGLQDRSPPEPTWEAVNDLLEAGGYDWMHVAAHGNFHPESPDSDAALWLQGDRSLVPQDLAGMEIEGHLRASRPAFFFNACEVGRQGWGLTRIGGWANRLISAGAGVFIAPLWSVNDGGALDFAKTFYQCLFSGETLAAATQRARQSARRAGDPTYLAYSVYGHPNGRLVTKDPSR